MADRLAATRQAMTREEAGIDAQVAAAPAQPAAPLRSAEPTRPADVRHVWVHTEDGRVAGLLVEWRQTRAAWFGRCVYPQGRVVVEEWIAAALLEPVLAS
jgi:hypothetical protein